MDNDVIILLLSSTTFEGFQYLWLPVLKKNLSFGGRKVTKYIYITLDKLTFSKLHFPLILFLYTNLIYIVTFNLLPPLGTDMMTQ